MSHPFSTPAIRVSGNGSQNEYRPHGQRSPSSTNATSSTAIPMSIPGSREAVPPPLPPPKYIGAHISPGQDPGWQWGNTPHSHRDVSSSPNLTNVKPGSSLLSASLPRRAGREDVKSPREAPAFSRRSSQNSISHDLLSNPSHDGSDDESRTGRPSLANFRYVVNPVPPYAFRIIAGAPFGLQRDLVRRLCPHLIAVYMADTKMRSHSSSNGGGVIVRSLLNVDTRYISTVYSRRESQVTCGPASAETTFASRNGFSPSVAHTSLHFTAHSTSSFPQSFAFLLTSTS